MSLSDLPCYGSGKHAQNYGFIKNPTLVYVQKNKCEGK